jgi:hypothetical protein
MIDMRNLKLTAAGTALAGAAVLGLAACAAGSAAPSHPPTLQQAEHAAGCTNQARQMPIEDDIFSGHQHALCTWHGQRVEIVTYIKSSAMQSDLKVGQQVKTTIYAQGDLWLLAGPVQ